MYQLVQNGKLRKDGTAEFTVSLDHEYTVHEFIRAVLFHTHHWGYIRIKKGLPFASTPCCPYSHGKAQQRAYLPFDSEDMDRLVVSARADGGHGRMDYWLTLDDKREPETGSLYFLA